MRKKYTIIPNTGSDGYDAIVRAIKENDGYCCCAIEKNNDTLCPCKEFRELENAAVCHCGRYYKIPQCKTVALCGDFRFQEQFNEMQEILTFAGNIVLASTFSNTEELSPSIKEQVDNINKAKIAIADTLFVINVNDYINEDTKAEIEWAEELGKKILYLERHTHEE